MDKVNGELKTLHGILALIDIVNFTPQANRVGEKFTAQYIAYFRETVETIIQGHGFRVIESSGDAVLLFGTEPEAVLDIMAGLFLHRQPEDKFGFRSKFRMVAHSGYFQFNMENRLPVDMVSPEGIKVFRLEKLARSWELVVTHPLFQGIKPLLTEKQMEAHRMVLKEPLKGFDAEEWFPPFYRLRMVPQLTGVSNLLEQGMGELEQDVQSIPVFGNIYPPVPMEKNFINLSMKWAGETTDGACLPVPPDPEEEEETHGGKRPKHAGGRKENRPYHEFERKSVTGVTEIDVPTLYETHCKGIIFGLPGAGKTTILRHLAFQEFKNETADGDKKRIVLFVPCRGIPFFDEWYVQRHSEEAPEEPDRDGALEYMTWVFLLGVRSKPGLTPEEWVRLQDAEQTVKQAFAENRLTLLVDALDEAPDSRTKEKIRELFLKLAAEPGRGNRLFLTSRPSERIHLKQEDIPVFNVLSLTMDQVRAVARHLMKEDSEVYKKFDEAVWREEMVAKMAATPITALLVTAYFQAYEKFHHRFPMYDLLVKFILMKVWESIKTKTFSFKNMELFFKEIRKPGFLEEHPETWICYDALASLCFDLFYCAEDGKVQRSVNEETMMMCFQQFIDDRLHYEPAVQADRWIERFHKDHLLLKAGKSDYVFVHSTVMEYLAAYYLVRQLVEGKGREAALVRQCMCSVDYLELETLPIAGGSDLLPGFAIFAALRELKVDYDRRLFHDLAIKCLGELEWQLTKTLAPILIEKYKKPVLDMVSKNRDNVHWIYNNIKESILTEDKGRLKEDIERLDVSVKLSRTTLFEEYLDYEVFDNGDSELVGLRKELLYRLVQKEPLEKWLAAHKETEPGNFLQLDSRGYHREDKNFKYFQNKIGPGLAGFFGSPNLMHTTPVNACAVSPDGKTVLSASDDGTLRLWEAASGKEIRVFTGHKRAVNACAFSPDGTRLVSASVDKTLKLWETASGKEIRVFTGHKGSVRSCAFSLDGTRLVSASDDCTLKLWEAASGKEIRVFTGHKGSVRSCAFSPDGTRLVSASSDNTLKLWSKDSGKEIRVFTGHKYSVRSCAFSPDGRRLVSASDDNTLKLWNTGSGKEIRVFTGHKNWVTSCAFSPDGTRLVSASDDHTLKLWDTKSGKEIRVFNRHKNTVWNCAFSPDGTRLVSASDDHTLKLWDTKIGKEIRVFTGHKNYVRSCAFSPDGTRLVSASSDNTLKLWDTNSGKEIRVFTGHKNTVWGCAFSPNGTRLVSASEDQTLKLWETGSGKEIRVFTGHKNAVWGCVISPDGTRLVSASGDSTLKLWDAESGKEIRVFTGHK
ncbi:MAG: NACHT domain-containing protein, partial [bacterium]|nr:NACHT domain-containing protein [bacterium]